MKRILFIISLFITTVINAQQGQAPLVVQSVQQMSEYRGSLTIAKVNDALRGGIFNKVPKGNLVIDSGVVNPSVDPNFVWVRDISQSSGINVQWFGCIPDDTTFDNAPKINLINKIAERFSLPVLFTDTFTIYTQVRLTNVPWIGTQNKSAIYIPAAFNITATGEGKQESCIYNENYALNYNEATANVVNISGLTFIYRMQTTKTANLNLLSLANVKGGLIEKCIFKDTSNLQVRNTNIDLHACVKNVTFRNVIQYHYNESPVGGSMWIRNRPSVSGSYNENDNTEYITMDNCEIYFTGKDECLSVFGSLGRVRHVTIQNSKFVGLPGKITHAAFFTIFPYRDADRPYAGVSDVLVDNCYFEDHSFYAYLFRLGNGSIDAATNKLFENITVQNSTLISTLDTTSSFSTNIFRYWRDSGNNNINLINNVYLSKGIRVTYGINDVPNVIGGYISGDISNAVYRTDYVNGLSMNVPFKGFVDTKEIYNTFDTCGRECIDFGRRLTLIAKNNTFLNTRTDGVDSRVILIAGVDSTLTPQAIITNNKIISSQTQTYWIYRQGYDSASQLIGNTFVGPSSDISQDSRSGRFKVIVGNTYNGVADAMRNSPYLNYNHNKSQPVGSVVLNPNGTGYWVKTADNYENADWTFYQYNPQFRTFKRFTTTDGNINILATSRHNNGDTTGYGSKNFSIAMYSYGSGSPGYVNPTYQGVIYGTNDINGGIIAVGGGSGAFTAPYRISLYANASGDTTTTVGTEIMRIGSNGVAIKGFSTMTSAALVVGGTTQGVLIPRLTKTQRNAISSPAGGLMVIVTGESGGEYLSWYNSSTSGWVKVTSTSD